MKALLAVALSLLPSVVKVPIYRALGMQIGCGVHIGFGAVLLCQQVEILDGVSIGNFLVLRCQRLRLGARSTIGNFVKATAHTLEIGSQCTISGPNEIAGDPDDPRSLLAMGPACWLLPHCYVNVAREIRLGRNVGVGGGSYLFTHGLWLSKLDGFPVSYGSITIKDDVWLPWGCFIMPGVMIGSGAIIGARSVVNKSLPAGVLAAGVPAKVLRDKSNVDLTPDQRAKILEEISSSLAESRRTTLQVECDANSDTHLVGGEPVLVLHKPGGIDRATLNPRVLNVTYDDLDTDSALATPSWSLVDYRSSPFAVLPAAARDWLAHARIVGVRFYPIDEDPI